MAGLFDNIFGGGGGNMFGGNSLYADMLTPEQMAAVRNQSMMQVAAKLLESSGPSTTRRTLGQTLGGALSAGAEAMQTGQANAVQQMLLKQKIDAAKQEAQQLKRWNEMFGTGDAAAQPAPLTATQAILAPDAGRVGPTVDRASMIGTTPPVAANQAQSPLRSAISSLNLNPVQQALLQQAGPQKGFSELNTIMSQTTRRLTPDELAANGLPQGTAAQIDGTGKISMITQPRLQVVTDPSGAVSVVNLDAMYSGPASAASTQPVAAQPTTATTARPPAAARTPSPTPSGGARPGVAPLFPASLNPEQVMSESRNWTTSVYSPVSDVVQNFETVKELLKSGQGGISDYGVLIKSIKALEPNSAVMQGEADSARNMMSLANRMESIMGKVESGGMGSDQARMQLAELARSATRVAVDTYNKKLARQRNIYGSSIQKAQMDAILAEIPMPAGAESSEALRAIIMPQQQSGGQGGGPRMVYNPATRQWEQRR